MLLAAILIPLHVYSFFTRLYTTNAVLDEKLGLSIPANEVRLLTHSGDLYRWFFLPEKKHLFKKLLSKHSTGAYRKICSAISPIEQSIEARKRDNLGQVEIVASDYSASFSLEPESNHLKPLTFTLTIEALT